jgi:hypothetical protein
VSSESEHATSLADFKLPYEATKDTEWNSNPRAPKPRTGSLKKGDKVFFSREPSSTEIWQDARIPNGTRKFVHPADFKKL